MSVLLEICVDSPVGLKAAIEGGAARIELCSSLAVGGLTPSPGFMVQAARSGRPARAMIRPRVGDYVFTQDEIDVMRGDIDAARKAGLAGVVIGASLPSWHLDEKTIRILAEHAAGLELTLNRTVDMAPDPLAGVDIAASLGFRSILTSGGSLKAPDGIEMIAAMVKRAAGRVEILAGSGLNPDNVRMMVEKTGVREVHGSFAAAWPDPIDEKLVRFGYIVPDARETSQAQVRRAKDALAGL
ncbi:MAG TPA: copper homeostasis protein CutC [Rhizomicrobium sp.]|jgi:copper homeostasis protein